MNELIHADIFFYVTTIVVAAVGVVAVVILFYLVRILSDVKDISRTVKEETERVAGDVQELRHSVRNGKIVGGVWSFFRSLSRGKKSRK